MEADRTHKKHWERWASGRGNLSHVPRRISAGGRPDRERFRPMKVAASPGSCTQILGLLRVHCTLHIAVARQRTDHTGSASSEVLSEGAREGEGGGGQEGVAVSRLVGGQSRVTGKSLSFIALPSPTEGAQTVAHLSAGRGEWA